MSDLPTPEQVDASVTANLIKLEMLGRADELSNLINVESQSIAESRADAPTKFRRIIAITNRAASIVQPISACKRGCSHCCNMAVTITSHEARLIGDAIGVKPKKPGPLLDREAMVQKYMNVPCVFLKGNQCGIYSVRPQPCITHFNISAYPAQCDTLNHPEAEVPAVDFRPLWYAQMRVAMEAGNEFGDIRAFFPNGFGK